MVTPYYNRPSRAGLAAHFRTVAAATDLPVVLYDIPVRSGRRIGTELIVELAHEVTNILAVKDATGDLPAAAVVVAEAPEGFEVYCGDDALTLPFLSVGGVGVISVASHWAGPAPRGHDRRATAPARSIGRPHSTVGSLESYRFESSDEYPNPVPAKAACRALGLPVGQCRLPHVPAPEDLDDLARSIIARSGAADAAQRSVA